MQKTSVLPVIGTYMNGKSIPAALAGALKKEYGPMLLLMATQRHTNYKEVTWQEFPKRLKKGAACWVRSLYHFVCVWRSKL